MKKYYLHIGDENSGPFDLEELKIKKISKKTPVWFEGLENWKYAEDIEELKSVFVVLPPPIQSFQAPTPITLQREEQRINPKKIVTEVDEDEDEDEEPKILGLSKNTFFMVLTFVLLLIGTFIFNSYQDNRDRLLEQRNHKTEIENRQYIIQQKQIEEQKIALEEQARLEAERLKNEKKISDSNRLIEIQNLISLTNENLENAKTKMAEVSGFKFFRSADEKEQQIETIKKEINSYLVQIDQLKKESNQLNLELEKLK